MATVTIDLSKVDHVLPEKFFGFNFSVGYYSSDFSQSQYQQLMKEIDPEVFRMHDFKRSNGVLYSGFNNAMTFAKNVIPNAGIILDPDSGPDKLPSAASPCSVTNLAPNGSGRSPQDHANFVDKWLNAGINVLLIENVNEPWGHCAFGGPYWYGTGGGANPDGYKCETWASIHQRDFYKAINPVIDVHGAKTGIGGHVIATSEGYGYGWTQAFINADAIMGSCSSPIKGPGANIPYFDDYVFHGYPSGSSNQDRLNSLLTDPASPPNNGTSVFSKLKKTRAQLDAAGGSNKGITIDEAGLRNIDSLSGICDAIYAVIMSRYQARFGIRRFCYHSANTDSGTSGIYPLFTTSDHKTFNPTVRSCVLRDIVMPFIRNYKHQVVPVVTGSGSTAGTYSVPRIQASAGLSADGKTLGVLVINVDLSNSESVTIPLGLTPAGQIKQTSMKQGASAGKMPSTLLAASSTITHTLEPGSVYFYEIPVEAIVPVPVPPPHTPSPDNTVVGPGTPLYGSDGSTWEINAAGVIVVNGADDTTTSDVVKLAYEGGKVWQQNTAGLWWYKVKPTDSWLPNGGTSTNPIPVTPPTPTPTAAELIDLAVVELSKTTASGATMVQKYGTDPSKWPSGHWTKALGLLDQAASK